MAMTKQHFEFIASTLAMHGASNLKDHARLVDQFANRLAKTNPQFDRQRFTAAAGGVHYKSAPVPVHSSQRGR